MHELSIAENIIEISEASARAATARRIRGIKVRLGEFTTVVREALEFSFEVARRGTLAEDATLEIETVPLEVRCVACGSANQRLEELRMTCPQCGKPLEIVSGDALEVEYIELD
jgi:hydrogenase nickel incorporation protein HypA/HybF